MSGEGSESSRDTGRSHSSSWWSRVQAYFEEAVNDYNQSGQEDPSLRDQIDYANQSNAEEVPEAFKEDVSRVSNIEKRRSTSTYKNELAMYEQLTRMEQPSCCMRGLRAFYHCLTRHCCNFDVKVFYEKPLLWSTPATSLAVGFLIRENCLGIIAGIIIGFLAFALFLVTFGHAMHIATLASCYTMLFAVFGISFSEDIRCVFMLVLPYLVAARARWLLMVYATVLTTMGPGLNFLHNSGNFRNAIGCVLGQVNTNLRLLDKITEAPMCLFGRQVREFIQQGNEQLQRIRNLLGKIKFSLLRVNKVMRTKNSWIKTLVAACGDEIAMKNQCLAFFNALYFNCRATMTGAKFICKLVRLFAGESCVAMKGLNDFCELQGQALQSQARESTNVTPEQIEEGEAALLNLIGRNNVSMESGELVDVDLSTSLSNKAQITSLIEEKMDSVFNTLEVFKNMLSWFLVGWTLLTVAQLVLQAALFRRNWLKRIYYDNVYITPSFIRQEKHALENQLIMTLPLSFFEKRRYVRLSSFWWSNSEKRAAFSSFIFILVGILSIVMVIAADYTMYIVLVTTGPAFSSDFGQKGQRDQSLNAVPEFGKAPEDRIQPKVEGNSTLASMATALLALANPLKNIAFDVDASVCRPKASPPSTLNNGLIGAAIVGMLTTIVFQVYVMRLRHVICGWYYPQRETDRAGWLRAYIRNSRGLFNRMVHRFRTRHLNTQRGQVRLPILERYLLTHPDTLWYLGFCGIKRAYCISCGECGKPNNKVEFAEKFTQCSECGAYYCLNCQVDLKQICLNCRIPLNVLKVDVDLEKVSSEEEMEYFCGKYLKRNPHDNFRVPPEEMDFDTMMAEYDRMWTLWRAANAARVEREERGVSSSSEDSSEENSIEMDALGGVVMTGRSASVTQPFPIGGTNTELPATVDVAQAENVNDMIPPSLPPLPTDTKEGTQVNMESATQPNPTPSPQAETPEPVGVAEAGKTNEIIPPSLSPLLTSNEEHAIDNQEVPAPSAEPAKGISSGSTQEKTEAVTLPTPAVSTLGPETAAKPVEKPHESPIKAVECKTSQDQAGEGRPVAPTPAAKVAETRRRPESGDKGRHTSVIHEVSKGQRRQSQPRNIKEERVIKRPPHPQKGPKSDAIQRTFPVKGETPASGQRLPRKVPPASDRPKPILQKTQSREDKRLVERGGIAKRQPIAVFDENDMDVDTAFDDPMLGMELPGLDRKRTKASKDGDAERGLKVTSVFDEYDMEVDTAMRDSALKRAIESDGLYDKPLFGNRGRSAKRQQQTAKGNRKGLPTSTAFDEDDMSVDDAMDDPRLFDDVQDDGLLKDGMSDDFLRAKL